MYVLLRIRMGDPWDISVVPAVVVLPKALAFLSIFDSSVVHHTDDGSGSR